MLTMSQNQVLICLLGPIYTLPGTEHRGSMFAEMFNGSNKRAHGRLWVNSTL